MTSVQFIRVRADLPNTDRFHAIRSRPESLDPPRNLQELIKGLHYIFEDDQIDVESVKKYIASYKSNKTDWGDKAIFDQNRYTRNLIDEGNGKFNLMLLCWGAGQESCIHDHADSHCFMKMLEGSLQETQYSWPSDDGPMKQISTGIVKRDEVVYINDSIGLHRVGNHSPTEPAVSLHLYSPPFQMCQTFDEKSGHKVKCNVTFYSKYGQKTQYNENDLSSKQSSAK